MRHLITGGNGFLGTLIARHLCKLGHQVRVIDTWQDEKSLPSVEFMQGTILDRELVRDALCDVQVVHHTAALVPLTKASQEYRRVNVEGSKIVADEAVAARVSTFIHMSSSAVFGAPPCPVTAESQLNPIEPYGESKMQAELAVQSAAEGSAMRVLIVRPRTIIAPDRLGIFQILFEWIKENVHIYVIGSGKQKIQFVHADDLIDAYMLLCDSGKQGAYNVGTDSFGTIKEDLEDLCAYAASRSAVKCLPEFLAVPSLQALDAFGLSPLSAWHYLTYGKPFYFDVKPLLDLGWRPRFSNREMLRESYDSFLTNYDVSRAQQGGSAHRKPVKQKILRLLKLMSRA